MARIRTIKPEFWSSEQIVSCCIRARLLFIGMWSFADDNGVLPKSHPRLKMQIFPGDECSIADLCKLTFELESAGLILDYCVGKEKFWLIIGFKKHQKIEKPTYRFPLPNYMDASPIASRLVGEDSSNINVGVETSSTIDTELLTDKLQINQPGNGMEGSVMDINISKVAEETLPVSSHETADIISQVFNYWRVVLKHSKAKLDATRRKKIIAAIKLGFSFEELKQAIDGCSRSPFHMGSNDQGRKYDDINLIFRNAAKIEMFIGLSINVDTPNSIVSQIDEISQGAI